MAQMTASQLRSGFNAVTSSASKILHVWGTDDNPAPAPPAVPGPNAEDTAPVTDVQLPSPPAQLSSAAACEAYLASLPDGPAAMQQLTARAATFLQDAASHSIQPEVAGPELHRIVVEVSEALSRTWPRGADGFDGEQT